MSNCERLREILSTLEIRPRDVGDERVSKVCTALLRKRVGELTGEQLDDLVEHIAHRCLALSLDFLKAGKWDIRARYAGS
ncbi:hypothetical protein LCGC14_1709850 [marine sediment metagenome]|uniref:Uncharacterized protein n=1 Tax=marine sediment metagenome TaxID=412755 RepID=A0A0F9JW21_9ZZZZ